MFLLAGDWPMPMLRSCALMLLLMAPTTFAAPPPAGRRDLYGDPLPVGAVARMGTVRWYAGYNRINQMALLPGGKFLATVEPDCYSVWDLKSGRRVWGIHDKETPELGIRWHFSANGDRFFCSRAKIAPNQGVESISLELRDTRTGKLLSRVSNLRPELECLASRGDGRMAACVFYPGTIVFWQPGEKSLRTIHLSNMESSASVCAFSRDGKRLYVVLDDGIGQPKLNSEVWSIDIASGKLLSRLKLGPSRCLAIAPNDGTIATLKSSGEVSLYDTDTGQQRRLPVKGDMACANLSFTPNGRTLLGCDHSAELACIWDVATGQLVRRLRLDGLKEVDQWSAVLLSNDCKTVTSAAQRSWICSWDARTGQPLIRVPGHVTGHGELAFSYDGKEIVSQDGEQVHRWDSATGKCLGRVVLKSPAIDPRYLRSWLLAPGGARVAERCSDAIRLYDTRTGKCIREQFGRYETAAWTFTTDGRTLATAGPPRVVTLWDTTAGNYLRRLDLGKKTKRISWICFTPDGNTFATGEDRKVFFWETATAKLRRWVSQPETYPTFADPTFNPAAVFSPDGRYLFTYISDDGSHLGVWDTVSQQEVWRLQEGVRGEGWDHSVVGVSADGRFLAWGDCSGDLRVAEIATGQIIHRFEQRARNFAFSPTGWRLATSRTDEGPILVWDIPTLLRSATPAHTAPCPDTLWSDLASASAMQAHRSLWRLAALPEADALLNRLLRPVEAVPAERLQMLLAGLGNDDFGVREKSERELAEAAESAVESLGETHRMATDLEVRFRVRRLLDRLDACLQERLRDARAVLVLEARATPAARQLLARPATGVAGARLTQEAKAALGRLESAERKIRH
jgi:WD40 repeat protein